GCGVASSNFSGVEGMDNAVLVQGSPYSVARFDGELPGLIRQVGIGSWAIKFRYCIVTVRHRLVYIVPIAEDSLLFECKYVTHCTAFLKATHPNYFSLFRVIDFISALTIPFISVIR